MSLSLKFCKLQEAYPATPTQSWLACVSIPEPAEFHFLLIANGEIVTFAQEFSSCSLIFKSTSQRVTLSHGEPQAIVRKAAASLAGSPFCSGDA